MILTCPQCSARFQLAAELLAPSGKTVRCSACHEAWFEKPELRELAEDLEENRAPIEDIPDGVKPIPDGSNVPALTEEPKAGRIKSRFGGLIGGFVASLLFFVVIFSGLLVMKSSVISVWPESYVFYKTLGVMDHVPGQGLIFDRLSAKQEGGLYVIEGHVINLTSGARIVPLIEASLIGKNGTVSESWIIEPPVRVVAKEETMAFRAEYKPAEVREGGGALDVFLRFVIKR